MSKSFRVIEMGIFAINPVEGTPNACKVKTLPDNDFETWVWVPEGFEYPTPPCTAKVSVSVTKAGKLNFSFAKARG